MSLPNFSSRQCKICNQAIVANIFGKHIFSHSDAELATWPGGMQDVLYTLQKSLQLSIVEAEGFPNIQAQLQVSAEYIEELKTILPHPNG
jgi:hypothetical protein